MPTIITYNHKNEFLGHEWKNDIIENECGINSRCATTANTHDKGILYQIHHVIANWVHTIDLQNNYQDEDDPW